MDVSLSSWFVILFAVFAANLPFMNERLFGLVRLNRIAKPAWMRLCELLGLYLLVLGTAYLLEARMGKAFSQKWEFYAVTVCLFLVFAYPGFVLRYLRKQKS